MSARACLAAAGLLLAAALVLPTASAWSQSGTGKWCSYPVTLKVWNAGGTTGHNYAQAIRTGYSVWSAANNKVELVAGHSGDYDVKAYDVYDSGVSWYGQAWKASSNGCAYRDSGNYVKINRYYTDGWSYERVLRTSAHEFGHFVGFGHATGNTDALMYTTSDVWTTRPYIAPVYDEMLGMAGMYGGSERSSYPASSVNGGAVSRDASGYPTNVRVTTTGAGKYAFAGTDWVYFPTSTEAVVMYGYITPSTLYRGAMCICWTRDASSPTNRMYNVEIDESTTRFIMTWSKSDGTLGSQRLWDGSTYPIPSEGVQYFVTLVAFKHPNGGNPYAYAYVHRVSTEVHIAHIGPTPVSGTKWGWTGSSSYSMGVGAWTDSTSNPASSYNLGIQWAGYG
ncbi:MAG TPA: hypothetical protein VNX21_06740 [Candidatus Thermoplasmatota archaeon]|nr:hypothetical protein [Candidatus Thermoplasmatota archaeon]